MTSKSSRFCGKVTGSAAMGTIAAERVLDGLFVAVLLAVTLVFVPRLPLDGVKVGDVPLSSVPRMGFLLVVVFTSALLVLAFFLAARRLAEKLTMRIVGVVSPRLATRLSGMMGGLADGLRSLPDPRLMGPFLFQTAIYWVVNALGMWFLGWGCGLDMTPAQGFAVMGVLAMGILLPAGPGLFGTFQLSVFVALRMYLPENVVMREGAAYVFLMYLCQFVFHTVAGLGALWVEHIKASDALGNGDAR